ncbi:MAG: excinuclease ABC subunit UvrC [Leptospiraceae bacterium]|nr:excinuclease ABC subunit UvrC [Leptospiraceae bacterium]MDW7975441.1 excinuclease ABC subunit UvrC [Leptospiraceae bacterium]
MEKSKENFILQEQPQPYEVSISSEERILFLKQKIELAPEAPGCYLWKDQHNKVLYVGKSVSLKNRLKSYLRPDDYKHFLLIHKAYDVEWIITNNENEALILEDSLIKQYLPPFNVRLKDDKRYPYLCISLNEDYPRIFITRKYRKDGNRYFGPYTDSKFARQLLDLIHKTFPIRKVNQELPLKTPKRPCMNYFIKRCLAPCQGNIPKEEYQKVVDEIILFLEGRKELLEEVIIKRMNEYSSKMEYEKAAIYRDILIRLKQFQDKQSNIKVRDPDQDVIAIAINQEYHKANAVVLEFRNAKLVSRKSFSLYVPKDVPLNTYEPEMLAGFLREYYLHFVQKDQFPATIIIPLRVEGLKELQSYLKEKFQYPIKIIVQKQSRVIQLAKRNAELLLKEKILGVKNKQKKEALKELQQILKLPKLPEIIECYDISHFAGNEIVASGVRFIQGQPHPKGYRHYLIKSVQDIHDPESIKEVIFRRIRRLKEENQEFPDLIVVDGGLAQVNFALKALEEHQVFIPVIGLAKKQEEIYLPHQAEPLRIDPNSLGMLLLREMRDEAHRFANTHQSKRMRKRMFQHVLDTIPKIGEERKKKILKYLENSSLEEIQMEDLLKIKGIGKQLAQMIYKKVQEQKKENQI